MIYMKRAYEDYNETDGYRILVDRLWPRGVSKAAAHIDYWGKELTPSTDLRKWFNHEANKFPEFKQAYRAELLNSLEAKTTMEKIATNSREKTITLVYGAKDQKINHVVVLLEVLVVEYKAKVEAV